MSEFSYKALPNIGAIDLSVVSFSQSLKFYKDVFGARVIDESDSSMLLSFGNVFINLKPLSYGFYGCLSKNGLVRLFIMIDQSINAFCEELACKDVAVLRGPTYREGAMGNISAVYIRDPDLNIIEVGSYAYD